MNLGIRARIHIILNKQKLKTAYQDGFIIGTKKEILNIPQKHRNLITKQEKINKMRRETAQANMEVLRNIALAQKDLIFYSKPTADSQRFTKINLEWMK